MYYFIGIKGTGMASLAIMLHNLGHEVMGSDLEKHFFTEDELRKRNITILPFSKDNIKEGYTVIIGNAFLEDFEEVKAARSMNNVTCYRYHEFLGELMKQYYSVTVSGSHGKTTTTAMLRDVFSAFKNTGYLIGDGEGYLDTESEYLCVEACEYRRHFLAYQPEYAIINNIEIDHVDYFKDEEDYFSAYQEYVRGVKGAVFYNGDDEWCRKLEFVTPAFSFGLGKENDFHPEDLEEDENGFEFDLYFKGTYVYHFYLPFVGKHLLYDALGVLSLATMLCFEPLKTQKALSNYHHPKRRYVLEEDKDSVFIDDYAHHPTEVRVTLEATRQRYPDRKIIAIFKPHRASRVQYFADDFAKALSIADEIFLLDFTSIDDKQDGVDIDISYLSAMIKGSKILEENENGARTLASYKGSVYVFMSSKDIYNLARMTKDLM